MRILVYIFILILISGCSITSDSESRSDEEIKSDLGDVASLIAVIQAGLEVVDEDAVIEDKSLSRAISPNLVDGSDSDLMDKYFGVDWASDPYTPYEVFTENPDEVVDGVLNIPSSGYISGLYGEPNNDFYMTMEEEATDDSDTRYRIKLYIYPRDTFSVDYNYEEYIVDESLVVSGNTDGIWAWSYYNEDLESDQLISSITYYRDDTYLVRDLDNINADSGYYLYSNVKADAPSLDMTIDDLIVDYSDYSFTDSYTTTTDTGNWSSTSYGTVYGLKSNRTQSVTEYYTEDGDDSYSLLYMEYDDLRNRFLETVTRYSSTDDGTNILSVTTLGNTWSTWYTEFNRISTTDTTYNSEQHIWYRDIENITSTDSATSIYNDLEKIDESSVYEGYVELFWSSTNGNKYSYSIDSETGEATVSWFGNTTRSLNNTTIDFTDLENITVGSDDTSWTFDGGYELGELIGTYEYGSSSYEVTLTLEGIEIDDTFYEWLE